MAATNIEAVPVDLCMLIPRMDEINRNVPGMHTEADVAYGALSTMAMAVHDTARAVEQGDTFLGHHIGAVAIGWNEHDRACARFTGVNGTHPATGEPIHAEAVVGAKARAYGMRILYLGVVRPAQLAGENGTPYPCGDCRAMFTSESNAEFTPRTILVSGAASTSLMLGTLAQLDGLYDPSVRQHVSLHAVDLPPTDDRTYTNQLFRQLGAQWARIYPSHRSARSLSWAR